MKNLGISLGLLLIFYFWAAYRGRKLKARIERIRKVHGPDARICYMNMRGKRFTWQISIESVRRRGKDWVVTAWCYEKDEFLIFYASRIYDYFDFNRYQEVRNVSEYLTERFAPKPKNQQRSV
jgi:hypothetical protein